MVEKYSPLRGLPVSGNRRASAKRKAASHSLGDIGFAYIGIDKKDTFSTIRPESQLILFEAFWRRTNCPPHTPDFQATRTAQAGPSMGLHRIQRGHSFGTKNQSPTARLQNGLSMRLPYRPSGCRVRFAHSHVKPFRNTFSRPQVATEREKRRIETAVNLAHVTHQQA
jgi:hypothetical protein